jgi:uncharacterized protein
MTWQADDPRQLANAAAGLFPFRDMGGPDRGTAHPQPSTERRGALAARFDQLRKTEFVIAAPVVAAACTGLVLTYATALSYQGFDVSTLGLIVVLVAATLSSIAGFAFSAICGVMLLQVMRDPVQVVEIMMVCSIAIQSLTVTLLWRDINWKRLGAFLIGGPIGLPLGVGLLLWLDPHVARHVIGAVLTGYAAWVLLKRPAATRPNRPVTDIAVGFIGGVTGGLAGFPGAAVAAWCGLTEADKRRQRGTYQPFILVMQILALALIQIVHPVGMRAATVSLMDLEFIPPAMLGSVIGLTLFARLPDRLFATTVNALLLASGIGLLL